MVTTADETIAKVIDRYFPDYLLPPGPGDERYDPLVTSIHHATAAISRLDTWIQHIREDGPHEVKKCPKCLKLFGLVRTELRFAEYRAIEGFAHQFVPCKREGCGKLFRPIRTREYCSNACRQAAYRARKVQDETTRPDQLGPLDQVPLTLPDQHRATRSG